MEHLDKIHPERFYRELIDNAFLIQEVVEGEMESGEWQSYYNFEDAEDEASHDGASLSEYGNAFYFKDDKIYECVIYLQNMECTGVNLYNEPSEIKSFVKELLVLHQNDKEELLFQQPWAKKYLSTDNEEEMEQKNMKFEGNFGTLELVVKSNGTAIGSYQNGGTISGTFKDGDFDGEWENKGMEGIVKFTVKNGQLNGKWKKGKENGAMRGEWWGNQIGIDDKEKDAEEQVDANILPDGWGTASAMAALIRHMMVADKKVNDMEIMQMHKAIEYYDTVNIPLGEAWDNIDDEMQMYERLGLHGRILEKCAAHLAKTFDEDEIQHFWNILVNITVQDRTLEYYEYVALKYTTEILMPDVDFNELVVHMRRNGISVDDGQIPDYDEKYHEAKEIILSEGAALPEILCDVLLIGKNRAERIFEQFERDGIVTPKDENGKRKIIK
jgi:uncharacterized tellurite resistance protein B-like protein